MISYPALYLRALREFRFAYELMDNLRSIDEPVAVRITPMRSWDIGLRAPTEAVYRLTVESASTVALAVGDPNDPRPGELTETGLLEEDASIFQYKVEIDSFGTAAGYRQWLRERGRYTTAFRLLSRLMDPETAYIALPALVRAAFQTTWPVTIFASLVEWILKHGLAYVPAVGVDSTYRVLMESLSTTLPTATPSSLEGFDEDAALLGSDAWPTLLAENEIHPLRPLVMKLWQDRQDADRVLASLFHPDREFDRRGGGASAELQAYWPPVTMVRVVHDDVRLGDTIVIPTPDLIGAKPFPTWDRSYADYVVELITMKEFAFNLAGYYGDAAHNCTHDTCPIHATGVCRRWMSIPKEFDACSFPGWLEREAARRVDVENRTLVRTDKRKEVTA
jgi:hypothetical protein